MKMNQIAMLRTSNFVDYITEEDIIRSVISGQTSLYVMENKSFKSVAELDNYLRGIPAAYHSGYCVAAEALKYIHSTLIKYQNARELFKIQDNNIESVHIENCVFRLNFGFNVKLQSKKLGLFNNSVINISPDYNYDMHDFVIEVDFMLDNGKELVYDELRLTKEDSFFRGFNFWDMEEDYDYFLSENCADAKLKLILKGNLEKLKIKEHELTLQLDAVRSEMTYIETELEKDYTVPSLTTSQLILE